MSALNLNASFKGQGAGDSSKSPKIEHSLVKRIGLILVAAAVVAFISITAVFYRISAALIEGECGWLKFFSLMAS